jgi:hypothetical protein
MRSADPENEVVAPTESALVPPFMLVLAKSYGKGDHMTDHLKEVSPAAVLLGREIVSVDTESGGSAIALSGRSAIPEPPWHRSRRDVRRDARLRCG